jgi:hypothetical protein
MAEDEMVECRVHEGDPQGDGHRERHEQPPREAGEAAVQQA